MYEVREIDGILNRGIIEEFNALDPHFPLLQDRHFTEGFWWLAFRTDHPDAIGEVEAAVAFAGLVPFLPKVGYFKRCFVMPGTLWARSAISLDDGEGSEGSSAWLDYACQ